MRQYVLDSASRFSCGDGDIEIDERFRRVWRDGREVPLAPKEYALLICLAHRQGAPVTHDVLIAEVWKRELPPGSRTVAQHILELRRKLEECPDKPRYIRTTHRIGYELRCAPVMSD